MNVEDFDENLALFDSFLSGETRKQNEGTCICTLNITDHMKESIFLVDKALFS